MQRTLALLLAFACTALLLLREQRRFVLATRPGDSAALEAYCGAPPQGSEGNLTADGLKLVGVLVTIRHGDRSSIHSLPNTNTTARWVCRPVGSEQKQAAAQVAVVGLDGSPLYRPLLPRTLPGRHGDCAPGQLTPRGFAQHVALGRHLGRSFAPLLREAAAERRANSSRVGVYVRSTDYTRTQMSAAAFLYGLLPPTLRPPLAPPTRIHTCADEAAEVMHGVGLAASSKVGSEDGGGETERQGACALAGSLARAQQAAWRGDDGARDALGGLFGEEARAMPPTHVADALHSLSCHGMPRPCSQGGCVSAALAASFGRMGDSAYCAWCGNFGSSRSSRAISGKSSGDQGDLW
uniref:Acid phosphatase n=1 Tax=Emiliania huxleyi TaxID=2903 RepID=A0A7S3SJ67_EMIHU|mmetsp:Transcript_22996/g.67781  ORF Transcript_22996/g.67781 Transcript_22996/m.67781 type:complete len:352 (+) Transcript_22996:201-1256(+)